MASIYKIEAASMKLRAELASEIIERVRERKLTQAKAAQLSGVTAHENDREPEAGGLAS